MHYGKKTNRNARIFSSAVGVGSQQYNGFWEKTGLEADHYVDMGCNGGYNPRSHWLMAPMRLRLVVEVLIFKHHPAAEN